MSNSRREFIEKMFAASLVGISIPSIASASSHSNTPAFTSVQDEPYWEKIKRQFIVPQDRYMFNAANLCPSPRVVHERVIEFTNALNKDVSFQYRSLFSDLRKKSVSLLTEFIGASEGEVGITRNTSEANCIIAHGLDLKPGDEVIVWEQNHPSNREVWMSQAKRLGFSVVKIAVPANPTSVNDLIQPFADAITPKTKVISFSHISNLSGISLPAKEICQLAKSKGVLSLVDGAQSLGSMDLNVHDMECSFYTSSTHKWLMGPFENGLLYINKEHIGKIWPNTIGAGWKESQTVDENLCILGQRNDPSTAALPETLAFHNSIGKKNIQERVFQLNSYLKEQIQKQIPKAVFVTPLSPELSAGIVIINLPDKKPADVTDLLYKKYGIASAPAGGIRLSPHIYNTMQDIDYVVKSLKEMAV
jgi:isopenicillin-N epimerase